jgi:hypothetical protein
MKRSTVARKPKSSAYGTPITSRPSVTAAPKVVLMIVCMSR